MICGIFVKKLVKNRLQIKNKFGKNKKRIKFVNFAVKKV